MTPFPSPVGPIPSPPEIISQLDDMEIAARETLGNLYTTNHGTLDGGGNALGLIGNKIEATINRRLGVMQRWANIVTDKLAAATPVSPDGIGVGLGHGVQCTGPPMPSDVGFNDICSDGGQPSVCFGPSVQPIVPWGPACKLVDIGGVSPDGYIQTVDAIEGLGPPPKGKAWCCPIEACCRDGGGTVKNGVNCDGTHFTINSEGYCINSVTGEEMDPSTCVDAADDPNCNKPPPPPPDDCCPPPVITCPPPPKPKPSDPVPGACDLQSGEDGPPLCTSGCEDAKVQYVSRVAYNPFPDSSTPAYSECGPLHFWDRCQYVVKANDLADVANGDKSISSQDGPGTDNNNPAKLFYFSSTDLLT